MITTLQRKAAAEYWIHVLTGEIMPQQLIESRLGLSFSHIIIEMRQRKGCLEFLERNNPDWKQKFKDTLNLLLLAAEQNYSLRLDYHPQGLLKQAAKQVGIADSLFFSGKLAMSFSEDGQYLIVGRQVIDAKKFLESIDQNMIKEFLESIDQNTIKPQTLNPLKQFSLL